MTDLFSKFDERIEARRIAACVYLFLAAFLIHLVYLSQYARSPFFWIPELDPLYHDILAQQIVQGHVANAPFFRAPLYYYFLAGIYFVFGHSYWAARIFQALIGSASCVLTFRLGCSVSRPVVGLIAAVGMALYGPLIFADGELHTPVLEVFLTLCFALSALRAHRSGRFADWLLCGSVLGLSAITRPNALVLTAPALALALWGGSRNAASETRWTWLRCSAALILGVSILPGLVTLRNSRVGHDPVFIASQGGINFYLGNRPGADGFNPSTPWRYPFTDRYEDSVALFGQRAAEAALGATVTASRAQRYWYRQGLTWWREHPVDALRLTFKKAVLSWSHQEIRNNLAFDYVRKEWTPALYWTFVGFWIVGPLALTGMASAFRRSAFDRFLIASTAIYFLSFIAFFVADRYRLPMIPLLLLFAADALVRIVETSSQRDWRGFAPRAAVLAAGAVLVNVNWYPTVTPATWAQDYWSASIRYTVMGRLPDSERQARIALALDPGNPEIWSTLGEALYYQGRFADASNSFARAVRLSGADASDLYNAGLCEEALDRISEARSDLRQAIRIEPNYSAAVKELASLNRGPAIGTEAVSESNHAWH